MSKSNEAWFNTETDEVHLPKGRIIYPCLLEPRGMKNQPDSKPRYSVSLLIPKDANIDALKQLIEHAAADEFGNKWREKKLRNPLLKTADFSKLADLAEKFPFFVRLAANPEFPPFIFGPDAKPFNGSESDIYSGLWAIPTVRAYGYNQAGNAGVALGLQRIQLLDHDEPIAGARVATASGFEAANVGANGATNTDGLWA